MSLRLYPLTYRSRSPIIYGQTTQTLVMTSLQSPSMNKRSSVRLPFPCCYPLSIHYTYETCNYVLDGFPLLELDVFKLLVLFVPFLSYAGWDSCVSGRTPIVVVSKPRRFRVFTCLFIWGENFSLLVRMAARCNITIYNSKSMMSELYGY